MNQTKEILKTIGFTMLSIGLFLVLWTFLAVRNPDFLPSPLICIEKLGQMM